MHHNAVTMIGDGGLGLMNEGALDGSGGHQDSIWIQHTQQIN